MPACQFASALKTETAEILAFYRSLLHTPGCTWDEFYPNMETIDFDLQHHALYCLRVETGMIAALASAGAFCELDDLVWPVALQTPWELARVGVRADLQGSGLGTQIVRACIDAAKAQGSDGVRLLVACQNEAAQALYRKNGFVQCSRVHMYGHDYFAQQLVF